MISISLVIPVYNVSPYIERCIFSVMRQTVKEFECILVDDASPDDSIAKCEKIIAEYTGPIRFSILRHEFNRGLSAARNTGLLKAGGRYVLFVDSDDEISNDCVEKLVTPVLNDDTIEMVVGEYDSFIIGSSYPVRKRYNSRAEFVSSEETRKSYFEKKIVPGMAWNKLIKKDFFVNNDLLFKEGLLWEDLLWTFYVMKHLSHIYVLNDVTYLHYQQSNSISLSTDKNVKMQHLGMVYNEISSNLTSKEEEREAAFYTQRFCLLYIEQPHNKSS